MKPIITTPRLHLRLWTKEDIEPFWQLNQNPNVLEFLPGPMTQEQVKAFIDRINSQWHERGYTLWAVELKETQELIGFTGLNYTDFESPFTPAVEIAWRINHLHWGKGYATEAARAVKDYGFKHCSLTKIVSFTVPQNKRSIRVMEKIGLVRDLNSDFTHPKLERTHPLSHHVLYRNPRELKKRY